MTEQEILINNAKKGDVHSFAVLYESVYKEMYRVAYYSLGNPDDAADAVSEAVTDAFAGIKMLKEPAAFKGWIFKILSAKISRQKKAYVNKTADIDEIAEPADERASLLQEDQSVRELFFSLPKEDRLILSLDIFMGYKSEEIAEILKMPSGTIRSRKKRALDRLKKELM